MSDTPRVRGGLLVRGSVLVIGLALFAAGIVALLESRLGLSPWDVLHQGISQHTPLTFGEANIAVSAVVLTGAWLLGARVGVGTVANAVLVGSLVQLYSSFGVVERLAHDPLGVRIALLAAGLALMGVGTALYLGAGLGAGPRDSLMVVGDQERAFASASSAPRSNCPLSPPASCSAGRSASGRSHSRSGSGPRSSSRSGCSARSPLRPGGGEAQTAAVSAV